MLKFVPTVRLRELGKHVELTKYQQIAKDLNSVDYLVGECLARFLCDGACPALFIKLAEAGEEALPNMEWKQEYSEERLMDVLNVVKEIKDRPIKSYKLSENVIVLVKDDFASGEWEEYGYYVEGDDGVSIPAWKLATM